MDKNETIKIRLSTAILLILIIVLGFICCIGFIVSNKKITELENQISKLNSANTQPITQNNNISEYQTKELTDSEKQELFDKAIKENIVLIDSMISIKDFDKKDFSDEEIILLLPETSEKHIFSDSKYNSDLGFYCSQASIDNIEKSAKKVFGKSVNVNNANSEFIQIINENVFVEMRTGVGVLDAELISVDSISSTEYIITFKFISDTTDTYKLTIDYTDGNVIYKSFEK